MGEPRHQRVDVAVGPLEPGDLVGDPVGRQRRRRGARWRKIWPSRCGWASVSVLRKSGIWQTVPQQPHAGAVAAQLAMLGIARQRRRASRGRRRSRSAHQAGASAAARRATCAAARRASRSRARRCARCSAVSVGKLVVLDRLDRLRRRARRRRAVVPKVPSLMWRPARPAIWAISAACRRPRLAAVELAQAGEGDVVDIHVEAHADRVGRDQVVDLAGLVERDLGVAGARAERAEHHGGAAALAADQLGERVDVGGGERDHGAAPRQARDLARAAYRSASRSAAALTNSASGTSWLHQRPDGVGAEEHGLVAAARVQQPVGEDVAALADRRRAGSRRPRGSSTAPVERHRLDRADEVARARRQDALLAGDQGDRGGPLSLTIRS